MKRLVPLILAISLASRSLVFGLEPVVFVANAGSGTVSMIDPVTLAVIRDIPVADRPIRLRLLPDASKLYVSTLTNIVAVDTTTFNVVATIPVEPQLSEMARSPMGSSRYMDT